MARDMFRCGHLERQYKDIDKIGADDTDYATMDNTANENIFVELCC